MSAARAGTTLEAPGVIEIRCSRADFVVVVTDGLRRALRGREGALQVGDASALDGAVTRTGAGAQIRTDALPPQAARLLVYLAAGAPAELDVLADGALRARHIVAGPEAREALVLRRAGASWTVRAPAARVDDLAAQLAAIGAVGPGAEAPPDAAPPAPLPRPARDAEPVVVPPRPSERAASPPASPPRRRRRRALAAGAVVLAVAAAAGAVAVSNRDTPAREHPASGSGGRGKTVAENGRPPSPEGDSQAREVKAALLRLPEDPAALLPAEGSGQTPALARAAVPEGTTVTVDERTWAPDGLGGGVVRVTLTTPDGKRTPYAAVMVRERGAWKVLSTVRITS